MSRWRRQQKKRSRPARISARARLADEQRAKSLAVAFVTWREQHPVQARRLLRRHGGDTIRAMLDQGSWRES